MHNYFSKQLALIGEDFSIEEIVLPKNKSLHIATTVDQTIFFYGVCSVGMVYPLDSNLKLLDSAPIVSGQIYNLPDNTKSFLLESLNTSDQDLKILKIVTRK